MGMNPFRVDKQPGGVNDCATLPRKRPESRLRCAPMIARTRLLSRSRSGRTALFALTAVLPVYLSCTNDPDTEPFVPALPGATQPVNESGSLISEEDACQRLLAAATAAYEDRHCSFEHAACPDFIRPAGASGCYEYSEQSVAECEDAYDSAGSSCSSLGPCFATAVENKSLPTCELVEVPGEGLGGAPGGGGAGGDGTAPGSSGAPADAGASSGGQGATPPSGGAGGQGGAP